MSEQRIRELLEELVTELDQNDNVDPELVATVRRLESDIDDAVNPEVDTETNTVMDDAIALEAAFAVRHPVAERILRELINTLSRIGI